MDFFTEDYLAHYGVKGMKWKKKGGVEAYTDMGTDAEGALESKKRREAYNEWMNNWKQKAKRQNSSIGGNMYVGDNYLKTASAHNKSRNKKWIKQDTLEGKSAEVTARRKLERRQQITNRLAAHRRGKLSTAAARNESSRLKGKRKVRYV